MFGRSKAVAAVGEAEPESVTFTGPRERLHVHLLHDFEEARRAAAEAKAVLDHAERISAQAAIALVEARKQMQRVANGTI